MRAGSNADAAAEVVVDDRLHGGGQRQGRFRGHVRVDGGLMHPCHAGDACAHALCHGVCANDDAAADIGVDDRQPGGGQQNDAPNGVYVAKGHS